MLFINDLTIRQAISTYTIQTQTSLHQSNVREQCVFGILKEFISQIKKLSGNMKSNMISIRDTEKLVSES